MYITPIRLWSSVKSHAVTGCRAARAEQRVRRVAQIAAAVGRGMIGSCVVAR